MYVLPRFGSVPLLPARPLQFLCSQYRVVTLRLVESISIYRASYRQGENNIVRNIANDANEE